MSRFRILVTTTTLLYNSLLILVLFHDGASFDSGRLLFGRNKITCHQQRTRQDTHFHMTDKIAGSFFNPIPDDDGKESKSKKSSQVDDNDVDMFDRSLSDMLKKRREPLASKPSTIGGVPTSKATGFGKKETPKKNKPKLKPPSSYVAIGEPDKPPVNDPTNTEVDDQGYTLYTNEETGEKSRVFEALVEYPCLFKIKIVGANEGTFVNDMVHVVAENCNVGVDSVDHSTKVNGKWVSVTVNAPVKSAEMLYLLYESIDRDPRVRFKF